MCVVVAWNHFAFVCAVLELLNEPSSFQMFQETNNLSPSCLRTEVEAFSKCTMERAIAVQYFDYTQTIC